MRSFTILAGLVGLAAAGEWNGGHDNYTAPWNKPTGSDAVSSSTWIEPSHPAGPSGTGIETETLVTYTTTTVCPGTLDKCNSAD
jgi:hypothetical protein